MKNIKIGFIGVGNMGSALARAVLKKIDKNKIFISDFDLNKCENMKSEYGVNISENENICDICDYIFLGVKPQMLNNLLHSVSSILKSRAKPPVLISMAAGVTTDKIAAALGFDCPIIRIMPNTPVSVGEGMILYSPNDYVNNSQVACFVDFLQSAGKIDKISENLIDAASAISGCGPAFVYIFAEAMADGGVECGLPRDKAIEFAAQTILGSAKLLETSKKNPAELKNAVCSPAGSTIAGVHALEDRGFRSAVINAVVDSFDRTKELGK